MFRIDPRSSIPAFSQLEFQVKAAMASGRLRPHDQLPSIREIADAVNLNPNTVAKTFRGLETEGYVYTQRGRGIFVAEDVQQKGTSYCRAEIDRLLQEVRELAEAAKISMDDY